ncbi:MAG: tRNA lysidine(34) synthetase TilS [Deltaproteobacteria bacterium RBG_13_49_15]|nr:MAG: tRNA lysidine(34) synthetase TilS [Deltaproteobacteria bacterium RBG_13_49_15]
MDRYQILKKMHQTITECNMIHKGDAVLVGVSGGPDSIALLHLLYIVSGDIPFTLGVAHLNHSLRPAVSDEDAEFVKSMAESLNLPYFIKKIDPNYWKTREAGSLEEKARECRYAFFKEIAVRHQFSRVALAHHAGDNAELVLMRLIRGSGLLGISGIPPVREDVGGGYRIIRPLIRCTRDEIMDFLDRERLKCTNDASNNDLRFLRNRIRHRLIPFIEASFNKNVEQALNRFADIARSEEEWIHSVMESIFQSTMVKQEGALLTLKMDELKSAHPAVLRRILRMGIESVKGNLRRIGFTHIERTVGLIKGIHSPKEIHLPDHIRIIMDQSLLTIQKRTLEINVARQKPTCRHAKGESVLFQYLLKGPGVLIIEEIGKILRVRRLTSKRSVDYRNGDGNIAFFDAKKIHFPLTIRNVNPGDRFHPLGLQGAQKVKKFFIDHKVSRADRVLSPILLSQNRIIWLAGHRIDDSVKVDGSTRSVMRAELSLDFPYKNG